MARTSAKRFGTLVPAKEGSRQKPAGVYGYNGRTVTFDDLPKQRTKMWWRSRLKADIVAVVRGGLASTERVCERCGLRPEDIAHWMQAWDEAGVRGLEKARQPQRDQTNETEARLHPISPGPITLGGCTLTECVLAGPRGTERLSRRRAQLLNFLMRNPSVTLARETIMQHIYCADEPLKQVPEPKIIDVFVCSTRDAVRRCGGRILLIPVQDAGYRLEVET